MKEKIRHGICVIAVIALAVGIFSILLYNISFNPSFSVLDVMSGATKKSEQKDSEGEAASRWGYTRAGLALSEQESYTEITLKTEQGIYHVLRNDENMNKEKNLVLLSDRENLSYQNAVQAIASEMEEQGYQVKIKTCSRTMMLSMVHAGDFTLFLMCEEDQ